MFFCDSCEEDLTRDDYYRNEGLCDNCLEKEDDWFDHLPMRLIIILDGKSLPSSEDVYDNIDYGRSEEEDSETEAYLQLKAAV